MANVMLKLGDFTFGVDTAAYQQLTRVSEYRWASQERIGQGPALQPVGPGSDTINVDGTIFPGHRGGTSQLENMRAEAGKMKPLILVDGRGFVHGRWVIHRVEEGQEVFAHRGAPRKQTFRMQIEKYDDGL